MLWKDHPSVPEFSREHLQGLDLGKNLWFCIHVPWKSLKPKHCWHSMGLMPDRLEWHGYSFILWSPWFSEGYTSSMWFLMFQDLKGRPKIKRIKRKSWNQPRLKEQDLGSLRLNFWNILPHPIGDGPLSSVDFKYCSFSSLPGMIPLFLFSGWPAELTSGFQVCSEAFFRRVWWTNSDSHRRLKSDLCCP